VFALWLIGPIRISRRRCELYSVGCWEAPQRTREGFWDSLGWVSTLSAQTILAMRNWLFTRYDDSLESAWEGASSMRNAPSHRRIFAIAVLLGLSLNGRSLGQEKGTPITFHVSAVRSEEAHDWCMTGECNATRFTVEGYADVKGDSSLVEYVLDCVQIMAHKPSPHFTVVCVQVHAHNDYDAKLYSNAILFGDATTQSDGPMLAGYQIVSEKEVNKQKR
jgi:hypothetical protein